jgi:hypothetical protein
LIERCLTRGGKDDVSLILLSESPQVTAYTALADK